MMTKTQTQAFFALLALSTLASAQSTTNNPPTPGNNSPPVTCSTGIFEGCGDLDARGYLLRNCPEIDTNHMGGDIPITTLDGVVQDLCAYPGDKVVPYILCQNFDGYVECEGYPSGVTNLSFAWSANASTKGLISLKQIDLRRVRILCHEPWSGQIDLAVSNKTNGLLAGDFAKVSCTPAANFDSL